MADISPDVKNRATLQPVTNAKIAVQDNGSELIGRGLAAFGAGVSEAAKNLQAIQDIHDEAAIKQADAAALEELSPVVREIKNARGGQALLVGELFEDKVNEVRERTLGTLKNDRQKRLFTEVFNKRTLAQTENINEHLDAETRAYAVDTAGARAKTMAQYAVDNSDNIAEFDRAILTVVGEVETIERLKGNLDPTAIKFQKDAAVSGVYTSVAEKLANTSKLKALDYINTNAGKILPDQETDLRRRLEPGVREERADNIAAEVIAELENGSLGNAVEGAAAAGEADPAKVEEATTKNADPLRGKGGASVVAKTNPDPLRGKGVGEPKGGHYGAPRDGGARKHGGRDIAAPKGTAVYPVMAGKVIEVDTQGKTRSGYYVKVRYADGHTESSVHLSKVHVKVGDDVTTDTVIGAVGGTGLGGKEQYGNHLHRTVRDPDNNLVDPDKYKPSGTVLADKTSGYVPKYDGDRVNLEGAYALARRKVLEKNPQATETEVNAVYERIDRYAARQDRVRDRRYDDAAEVASQQITELIKSGTPLTNPAQQIKNYGDLDPKFQQQLESNAATNRQVISNEAIALAEAQAREAADDNIDTVSLIDHKANTDPEKFMGMDLSKYKGLIPEKDFDRLRKEQSEMRVQGVQRPELDPKRSQAVSAVNYALGAALIDRDKLKDPKSLDSQRHAWLVGAVLKGIEIQQRGLGRPLSEAEIEKEVLAPLLRPMLVTNPGLFGDDVTKMPWYIAKRKGVKTPELYRN